MPGNLPAAILQIFQFSVIPVCSALVFEKWRDDNGQCWAHITLNGKPCVVGDAVARQIAHPLLQQPLFVFPMEVLEQALEQVMFVHHPHARARALFLPLITVGFYLNELECLNSCAAHFTHQEVWS